MTNNQSKLAIRTEHLSRSFGNVKAVNDVSLNVPVGSVFAFLGPNGAGKTTTIRMLLGLIRHSEGHISLNGIDLKTNRKGALSGVGSIVETPTLYPNLTGYEILKLSARLIKAPVSDIEDSLDLVNLTDSANRLVKDYSLGMRQRLALARCLLGAPKLLILDEPTNGLDPAGIIEMRNVIKNLPKRRQTTVLLSSHLLDEIDKMADHCALIDKGNMQFQGTMSELRAKSGQFIKIQSSQSEDIKSFLNTQNYLSEKDGNSVIVKGQFEEKKAEEMLRSIANKGFNFHHFALNKPSLEDIFLSLTDHKK